MPVTTVAKVKARLGITASTYDTEIGEIIPLVQDFIMEYTHNFFPVSVMPAIEQLDVFSDRFNVVRKFLFSATISFVASGRHILDSDNNFVNAGFVDGMDIRIQYGLLNDGVHEVDTVAAGDIVLTSDAVLFDEDESIQVLLSWVKFPKALEMISAKMIKEDINMVLDDRVQSERVGNTNFNFGSTFRGEYPEGILKLLKPWKRPVFI